MLLAQEENNMENKKFFEVRSHTKEKIPNNYFATKEELKDKSLRTAIPAKTKNKNGYYQTGRITAHRAE